MAVRDLTGQKFYEWTVLKELGSGKVHVRCSCGVEKDIYKKALLEGRSKSCGHDKHKNLVGQHFGEWTVLEDLGNDTLKCQCSCGKIKNVNRRSIIYGKSKSCGCHGKYRKAEAKKMAYKSYKERAITESKTYKAIGKTYGYLTVIDRVDKDRVKCRCICGNIKIEYLMHLEAGNIKSCGCMRNELRSQSIEDRKLSHIGEKYGYWTIVGLDSKNREGYYHCKCICGNENDVAFNYLRNGISKSCGCKVAENRNKAMMQLYGEIASNRIDNPRTEWQINTLNDKNKFIEYIKSLGYKPTTYELIKTFDIQEAELLVKIHTYGIEEYIQKDSNKSSYELELYNYIKSVLPNEEVEQNVRNVIDGSELDIYIQDKKLAIEFDGSWWHSENFLKPEYHLEKTLKCRNAGIRLIHIFEYEWNDTVKHDILINVINTALGINHVIYGRETQIAFVTNNDAVDFLNTNHLQGAVKSPYKLGLYKDNELVALMTVNKPRFDKEYDCEITRYCVKGNYTVVGGFNKLFKYFVGNNKVQTVLSYADIAKFSGNMYNGAGFTSTGLTKPGYYWVKGNTYLNRYKTQKSELVKNGYGTEDMTEIRIMKSLGFFRVYDCGNEKYVWNRK